MKNFTHMHDTSDRHAQRGFSLVELMVSIVIGLIILTTLISLFLNQSKARIELDKANRMIDNGSYAMDLLAGNLRLAGFYDTYSLDLTALVPAALYSPCDTASLVDPAKNIDILKVAVQGYNAATATSQATNLPCGLTYATGGNLSVKPGSDVLVIRRAGTAAINVASAVSGTNYLQVSMCADDSVAPPANYQIATAPSGNFANLHKGGCKTTADLRAFTAQTYFVSPDDTPGDGIPTLKVVDQSGNPTPLVEGIEYMQVDYGIDDTVDGDADRYTDCAACSLADWSNVVSVRINLVARNQEPTAGWDDSGKKYSLGDFAGTFTPQANDPYKRHAYTQIIRLMNPAGRREKPCTTC